MGLGTLVTRSGVIFSSFFDDIRAALIGDFVGRDTSGAAVAGNNLGNSLYPWGTIYGETVITSEGALSASLLETQPYQIVSGKIRSSSNQPDFIRASGSGQNFTVQATSTPLILQIKGASTTWSLDRTNAGTLAPSTQNTATVSDATAIGQAATRTWGEYGSGSPYYPINLASVGTNVSAKVNSWQAFKIGSEYFLAHVESTTSLSRCFRGFFLDSTGTPVPRSTFSNSATITLMSLGWVFCDADGATVDVTYNNPVFSFSAPSSPASGDYWFDQGNQVWKRYNGSSFILMSRILIGLIVLDQTNCVASRSFDFFGLTRSDNTIELSFFSTTVVKGSSLFSRINVSGKRIQFSTSRPKWDTAANLAASTERYNASVTASTREYFYISDQAETKISDMEPYWRPDLLGYYHPFNPWRAVGFDGIDGSANFQTSTLFPIKAQLAQQSVTVDLIADLNVTRQKLSPNRAVSSSSGSYGNSSATPSQITNFSVPLTVSGLHDVEVYLVPDTSTTGSYVGTNGSSQGFINLLRDGSLIATCEVNTNAASQLNFPPGFVRFLDQNPAAGAHTYSMTASNSNSVNTSVHLCLMVVEEKA